MSREKNFLLGQGERLSIHVDVPSGGGHKNPPYDFATAKKRIKTKLTNVLQEIERVPESACPKNQVVAAVTLHPRYTSKSDFPEKLFKLAGLYPIGGRAVKVTPENWGTKEHPEGAVVTQQLFVAGTKEAFHRLPQSVDTWRTNDKTSDQLAHIEDITSFLAQDKVKFIPKDQDEAMLEIVLHNGDDPEIIDAFIAYAKKFGSHPLMERAGSIRGLTFLPTKAPIKNVLDLAKFSFLRVVREMPKLRSIPSNILRSTDTMNVILPDDPVQNSHIRVAVFDGGVPSLVKLEKWVTAVDPPRIGSATSDGTKHGVAVTSALLFGHIDQPNLPIPFCHVDHIRIMDKNSSSELGSLDALQRILDHLDQNPGKYQFVNISAGPEIPMQDDEVTAWTAFLDDRLSKQDILAVVAVGNDGELDGATGQNRIQPPADGVNLLSIGACDQDKAGWKRASYSCIGPGRIPGLVKPDGVAFGGTEEEPFRVLSLSAKPTAIARHGTSFAAPSALRTAIGVKSLIGDSIAQRTLRALMIHRADPRNHSKIDVGWGKFEDNISRLMTCDDNEALILYQGELPVREHLRVTIPTPDTPLEGSIEITATLVIASEVDPEYADAYTRNGLEVTFRPHSQNFRTSKEGVLAKHPSTKSFFTTDMYGLEKYNLKEDGYRWETCLKNTQSYRATSLHKPCFDIYYHHRESASAAKQQLPIPYSLVVSIKAPKMLDFYNQVVRAYANILIPLRPQVQIQVQPQG